MNPETDLEYCIAHGVQIYPVYCGRKKGWFIEVRYGSSTKRYDKKIGSKMTIKGRDLQGPVEATATHWKRKIYQYELNKNDNNPRPADKVGGETKTTKTGQKDK